MSDIITTLHPENDETINLYPNIKKENVPNESIDRTKLDSEVNSLLNNIGELHPSGTDTSTNILAFTTNKGIYIATDNGHWYYWDGTHYVDGGLYMSSENYEEYYDLLKSSETLVEVNTSGKQEGYIAVSGGIGTGAPQYSYIDNITLNKGQTIFVKESMQLNVCVIAEYNTDYVPYVRQPLVVPSTSVTNHIFTYTAQRDMKISLTLRTDNSYECYILPTIATNINDLLNGKINNNSLKLEALYDGDFGELFTTSNNYFDKNNCYRARLDYNTGKMINNEPNEYCTDFIDCSGKNVLYIWSTVTTGVQAYCIAFYDNTKTFISAVTWAFSANVPSNAKYAKVSFTNSIVTNYNPMVMFDTTRPSQYVEPFKRTLKQFNVVDNSYKDLAKMFRTTGVVGDSLSSGEVYTEGGTPHDDYNHSWLTYFCIKSGATVAHYSAGGLSTKSWLTSGHRTNLENDTAKEAYFIALGTNDSRESYGIGNITDAAGTDSFVGYYKEIIDVIHTKAPNAVIFCVTKYGNTNQTTQVPYNNMIGQIAALYDYCFFVDFANNCPDELNLSTSRIYTFWQENWHYTGAGYMWVGEVIYDLVNEIVNNNQSWFKWFVANL